MGARKEASYMFVKHIKAVKYSKLILWKGSGQLNYFWFILLMNLPISRCGWLVLMWIETESRCPVGRLLFYQKSFAIKTFTHLSF